MYLNSSTYEVCRGMYPYLVQDLNSKTDCPRRVASLSWNVIDNDLEFEIQGVKIDPLP